VLSTQASALATAVAPHLFWITSRAAGIAALVLSSCAVCLGLLMSQRTVKGHRLDLRVAHEALSLATLVALVVHGLTLIGDGYLRPSIGDVAVPFLSSYKTLWTGTGIIAFWVLAALGISYYARRWIGVQRWRKLHRCTALAWLMGIAHSLGEGTDAGQTWFLAMTAIVVLPPLVLLLKAHFGSAGRAGTHAIDTAIAHTATTRME
jgi:sulfoxide reductase heme-binding subunit YedZ